MHSFNLFRYPEIPEEMFKDFFLTGMIADARYGGLVLGIAHDENGHPGIPAYQKDGNVYKIVLHLEGWEYVLNPHATSLHRPKIEHLNNWAKDMSHRFFRKYKIPYETRIIDSRHTIPSGILIDSQTQFIFNKMSTRKYLNEINRLNVDFPWGDFSSSFTEN